MEIKTEQFTELAKKELKDERTRIFLKSMPPVLREKREIGLATLPDIPAAMAYGAAIRAKRSPGFPNSWKSLKKMPWPTAPRSFGPGMIRKRTSS